MGHMNRANHLALAVSAGHAGAAVSSDGTAPERGKDDRRRRHRPSTTDGHLTGMERELLTLRKRCRARELALARLAGAVNVSQGAIRALNDENALLRQQVAEL